MTGPEERVLRLLARVCGDDAVLGRPDLDLYETGLLDSFGFIELLDAVEDELGVTIQPTQVRRDDLRTPRRVVRTVLGRMAGAPQNGAPPL